jgi:branched-chain amino acid transport system ATP-binding protein
MLVVENLTVAYGAVTAVKGISFTVPKGEIVTLLGANGAGKSSTLRALSGLVKPKSGKILLDGEDLAGRAAHDIVSKGLLHVPEGRMVFPGLTVTENLRMGAYRREDKPGVADDLARVFDLFPRLKEREKQTAGTMSGGEQQMLAIGRALMGRPRLLMLDEPSLGIAPLLTRTIFEKLVQINRELGLTLLLVEQNANLALEVAHHGHVLETGEIILSGPSASLRADPKVREAYLGE